MKNEMFYLDDSEFAIIEETALREVLGDEGYEKFIAERDTKKKKAGSQCRKKKSNVKKAKEEGSGES